MRFDMKNTEKSAILAGKEAFKNEIPGGEGSSRSSAGGN
jgi:hypothetical protein